MKQTIKILNYTIYCLLLFYLLIDSITGITLELYDISISVPYKSFVLVLMLIVTVCYNYNKLIYISLLFFLLIISLLLIFITNMTQFSFAAQFFIKQITNIFFLSYFNLSMQYEKNIQRYMKNIFYINCIVFLSNIILGVFGFGYSTYSYGVGIKGFFYAGNEIFLAMLCFTLLAMNIVPRRKKKIIYVISLTVSILIGTKTSILALFVMIIFNFYLNLSLKKRLLFLCCIPILVFLLYFVFQNFLSNMKVFGSMIYNIEKIKNISDSLLNALLSGRIDFFKRNMNKWADELTIKNFFLGGISHYDNKAIEIDFFDTLIINGAILSLIMLFFYIYLIIKSYSRKLHQLTLLNVLVFFISFTAGHVWTNLTGGIFLIMLNVFYRSKYSEVSSAKYKN